MKSSLIVFIWTFLLISFGIYLEHEVTDFTNKYEQKISNIEKQIKLDNFETAENLTKEFLDEWEKDIKIWYMILNNEYFDNIYGFINVLKQSSLTKDKTISLEYIEKIKMNLNNIIQYERLDFNHIL